jgi:Ca-activated chloride channel family protein
MQRWHLTLGLSAAALLAAALVPTLMTAEAPVEVAVAAPPAPAPQSIPGLSVVADLANPALPAGESAERYVVISLEGESVGAAFSMRPVNVAVVLDRSGSMGAQSKMSYAKQAARELVEALDADDRFALVTFADHAEVVVPSERVLSEASLLRSIYAVQEGGGTNLYSGLKEGFGQVRANLDDRSLNRVILLSDGNANVGIIDDDQLSELAGRWIDSGISVSAMGVGLDYNEDLLADMADQGGGSYRFIDNPSALSAVFAEELQQLARVSARGVSVALEMADGVELLDVLGYDEEFVDGAWRVRVGDVREGESRKVVARVRVPATHGDREVLSLAVSTIDSDVAGPLGLTAFSVDDRALLAAHENRELSVLAARAEASVLAQQATRAYERGDRSRMKALMRASQSVARDAAVRYNDDDLREALQNISEMETRFERVEASSSEGVFQVKRAKETYRASSR